MKTRIITGITGGAVLLGAVWWHLFTWQLLATVLAVLVLAELAKMSGIGVWNPLPVTGYMLAVALLLADLSFAFILPFACIVTVVLSLRDHTHLHAGRIGLYFFSLFYVLFAFYTSIGLYQSEGKAFVLFVFFLIWASDTFAYFSGSLFGKHPMAPVLSPKKTYEGLIGGMAGTILLAVGLNEWLSIGYSVLESVAFGLFIACFAPLGDLFESALKRHYGVKDAGKILPGHGGIFDRFDSFLFVMIALPLFFYFVG